MTLLDRLRPQLKRHEGVRLHAYPDSLGYWTIGVGRMIDARLGGGITEQEAEYLLDNDIAETIGALVMRFPWFSRLDEVRQAVLIDMGFMGVSRLAGFVKMLAMVRTGDYVGASAEMLDSKWARQVGGRAHHLSEMMRSGRWE